MRRQAATTAQRRLLRELPHLRLYHDTSDNWLYADWRGPQTAATVREGAEVILAEVATNRYTKLLNDNTRLTLMHVTEEEWRSMRLLPRLFNTGLQYMAWVYSPDPRGRSHADYSVTQSGWPLLLTFEEYNIAAEWLRQY
ncbi:hypothetical protein K3G63_13270 [Hymenobacter sp. HSC-4F20]|uniref:hypothetical protein n=1 Tax=Hymenobacter sp. HSC-4F20 TaxID=2864135 RepID=UPI001C735AD7|nr:hypothetical protein [Hymenobacter sp. HSC-4F20]MBX0291415.1 hypothetical protein [Hymenobacter sp. HSC-4F20]